MKSVCLLVCLFGLGAASTNGGDHPISKVIGMLEGLKMKSIMEGKQEAQAFAQFTQWCKESDKALSDAIADEKEKIAELEDLISGKTKDKEVLETEIEALNKELGDREASVKKANDDRKTEAGLYKQTITDVDATIGAVNAALEAVSGAEASTEGLLLAQRNVKKALALLSVSTVTTEVQLSTLRAFADPERPKQLAEGDEAAHVDKYKFKGGTVIELLKGLRTKFEDEKMEATKEETNALNNHELAMEAQAAAIDALKKSKQQKEGALSDVKNILTEAGKELKSEEADKEADSKSLADTKESCTTKNAEWEERSEVRANEITAMDVAKKILAKAAGVRTEAPGNPIPPASPVAFLQIASESLPKMSAVTVLLDAAHKTHSKALERLAQELKSHLSGPFDAVNNMVEKMIFRLMDEQKQEDEHKNWCDQELEKTNVMKDDKTDKIADLNAEIKTQTATVTKLSEEIKEAMEMIANIVKFKAEATEVREVGKKENKLAIDDSELAQKALADAIAVLTDFYKSSGEIKKEPWEFIQAPVKLPKNPATWDSPYTGVADPDSQPSGIVSVLETVMADFAKVEAETKSQEANDQKEFEQAMSDNDIEMARRTTESEMKADEKKRRASKISDLSSQKKDTTAELEKTEQYLTDLEPACVSGDSTYEDRKAARSEEIDALHKAQAILQDAFKKQGDAPKKFLQIERH